MTSSRPETYAAKRVLSLDSRFPEATHVCVAEGRIVALGTARDARAWGHPVDDRFVDCVLAPGFVEAHGHLVTGGIWDFIYVGAHDRTDPDGRLFTGLSDNDAVASRLEAESSDRGPVVGWGFDPLFVPGNRLGRRELDDVASDRPVAVLHSNMHLMTVNSAALALVGYTRDSDVAGLVRDDHGEPTGELREFAAMFPVMRRLAIDFGDLGNSPRAIERYARMAIRTGVTTATDMLNDLTDDTITLLLEYTSSDECPIRLAVALNALDGTPGSVLERARNLAAHSSERLRLGAAKVMTDGSIQAFTAQLGPPGYHTGTPDPMWNIAPEQLFQLTDALHAGRVQMHIHTNGDRAIGLAIDALERAVAAHEPWDHRHTLQHVQMASDSHLQRLANINAGANLFANHLFYFGDQHHDVTIGPERAARIDPCGSAQAAGLRFAIHSDTPVTPLAPLFTASCAMHRTTRSGRVLGPDQRLTAEQAFHAITTGAAWTLKMDREIGSLSPGKFADFSVLGADPLSPECSDPGSVPVLGTITGGRFFEA